MTNRDQDAEWLASRVDSSIWRLRMGSGRGFSRALEAMSQGPDMPDDSGAFEEACLAHLISFLGKESPRIPVSGTDLALRIAVGVSAQPEPIGRWLAARLRRTLATRSWSPAWLVDFAATAASGTYRDYWNGLAYRLEGVVGASGPRSGIAAAIEGLHREVGADGLMSRVCAWRYREVEGSAVSGRFDRDRGSFRRLGYAMPVRPALIRSGLPLDWRAYIDGQGLGGIAILDIRHPAIGAHKATVTCIRDDGRWHVRRVHQPGGDRRSAERLISMAPALCEEYRLDSAPVSRLGLRDASVDHGAINPGVSFMTKLPCALCGTTSTRIVHGRTGCACTDCLGEAAQQVLARQDVPASPTVTASDRCLLCGEPVAIGLLAAARGPYRLCHACIVSAVETVALPLGDVGFIQVNF